MKILMFALLLSNAQQEALEQARAAGAASGLGETMQALVLYESSACDNLVGSDHVSYGCGQLRQIAACDVDRAYCADRMDDAAFKRVMVNNRAENLRLSTAYLAACRDRYRFRSWRGMLTCYGIGPTRANALSFAERQVHPYAVAVSRARAQLRAELRARE